MKYNKQKRVFIVLVVIAMFFSTMASAKLHNFDYSRLPDNKDGYYYYDETGILSESTKKHIDKLSTELDEKSDIQILVAVVNDLDDLDIDSYKSRLYEKWEIGSKSRDEGALIVVKPKFSSSDTGYIGFEPGYGLEDILTSSVTRNIQDDYVIPEFKNNDYDTGVLYAYNAVLQIVTEDRGITLTGEEIYLPDNHNGNETVVNIWDIIRIILIIIVIISIFGNPRNGRRRRNNFIFFPRGGFYGGGSSNSRGSFGGGSFGGGGSFRGGGGRSGGGGSSGSW